MIIVSPDNAQAYTYEKVREATNQFARKLGEGGYGQVYYGEIVHDRQVVAKKVTVKVAQEYSERNEREFFNEVDVFSRVHHKNLVALVGYCQEPKQILIYEYMQNGSLFDHLHGRYKTAGTLNWRMRLSIAIDTAQGLVYLHTTCDPSFIHRDVKSSNILLTLEGVAKVADFGVTKLMRRIDGLGVITRVQGTIGYLDPE